MTGFLPEIVEAVRTDIALPSYREGLPREPPHPPASLRAAIREAPGGWALLVERKHRSPGAQPPELPERSIDDFVRWVTDAHVEGLSCLATRPAFAGSPQEVLGLTQRTRQPVLFKEFVIDPVQVAAARRVGASAVLLLARLETEGRLRIPLRELARIAHQAGLEVLLEFHAREEVKVVSKIPADLYGVNVRDLETLALRPGVAEETFRELADRRPLLGLSGVAGPEEARRFRRWGADGILVGGAFARSEQPDAFLASLRDAGGERMR